MAKVIELTSLLSGVSIMRLLVAERRRVAAGWRLAILLRRQALAQRAPLPDREAAERFIRRFVRNDFTEVEGSRGVYRVDAPYAELLPVAEEHVVQEANPWSVFSFGTALLHHGLTDDPPRGRVHATFYAHASQPRLPLGTMPEDWVDWPLPHPRFPRFVGATHVVWTRAKPQLDFGTAISQVSGQSAYMTDPPRTILDALRDPDAAGGVGNVFHAWRRAVERMTDANLDALVHYTEAFDSPLMRQRVGFLLEELGIDHPTLELWRSRLSRGGSCKLLASAPYAPTYSERWNLSLNIDPSLLAKLKGP
ncbi:MAG: hypothetical protein FLDDKLPJ_01799 [Phycisphaerae bacterium]|nr:hypothetical protein [Phycisphaerae bacterium]